MAVLFTSHLVRMPCRSSAARSYSALEAEVYRRTAQLLDLPTAAVLAMVQFVAVGAIARPPRTAP
ncbi:hypothetical protein SMICM304S_04191 [Streptomyces microflavus]